MSDLVGNPEDRFSHVTAHILADIKQELLYIGEQRFLKDEDVKYPRQEHRKL